MFSVVVSGLALFLIYFDFNLACFYEKHVKFLTSHIYFHLDDSELWKQNQSAIQEMLEQVWDLVTVHSQEIPIKVCVVFYNLKTCYRSCGEKIRFLAII